MPSQWAIQDSNLGPLPYQDSSAVVSRAAHPESAAESPIGATQPRPGWRPVVRGLFTPCSQSHHEKQSNAGATGQARAVSGRRTCNRARAYRQDGGTPVDARVRRQPPRRHGSTRHRDPLRTSTGNLGRGVDMAARWQMPKSPARRWRPGRTWVLARDTNAATTVARHRSFSAIALVGRRRRRARFGRLLCRRTSRPV
jgi:hypothetical protein